MNRIPAELLYSEVVLEPEELLAHRRGPHTAPRPPEGATREQARAYTATPDRYAPACDPKRPPVLQAMSAYSADQLEAEACDASRCFGRELAAGPRAWRSLKARPPKPSRSKGRRAAR